MPSYAFQDRAFNLCMLLPLIRGNDISPLYAADLIRSEVYFFFLRSSGPGSIQPSTIGANITNINSQPPILTRSPSKVQKLSGAQLFNVVPPVFSLDRSAPTLITEAASPPATAGTRAPELTTDPTPAAAVVTPPTIAAFFRLLHPTRTSGKEQTLI